MQYRREIDGLRAIAVLPVILFHAGCGLFSGGFVGVDIFFVISGYLITTILVTELSQGRFSIIGFYERRARRILPALFTVMFACLPFAYMWMLPSQLREFARSLVAVVFFCSNILFGREAGYFAADAELKPLLHTWSLAVEEQYYLLFPIFLLLAWRFGRAKVFFTIVVIAALSLVAAEWGWRHAPAANFYLAPFRAWELLAGSICAFLLVDRAPRSNDVLSALGLLLVLVPIFAFDQSTPFPSIYAAIPVVGTALIVLYANSGTWVARLLSLRIFVGIGLISYSAYLWHQPLFAFARLRSLQDPDPSVMGLLACAALLLAWATWYWIETPFRRREGWLPTRRGIFMASGAVGLILVLLGSAGDTWRGFKWRTNGDVSFASLDERIATNRGLHRDCEDEFNQSPNCFTSANPQVLLWGDSFAMHLAQGIVASDQTVALQQHTKSVCAPVLGVAHVGPEYTADWARGCLVFNTQVLNWLNEHPSVDLVILSSPFSQLLNDGILLDTSELISEPDVGFVAERIIKTAEAIRQTGARVIIVSPTPRSGWNNGQCLMRSVYFGMDEASCDFTLDVAQSNFEMLRQVERDVPIYWLQDDICAGGTCDVLQDDTFVFRDGGHLSMEGSAYLGRTHDWLRVFRRLANQANDA